MENSDSGKLSLTIEVLEALGVSDARAAITVSGKVVYAARTLLTQNPVKISQLPDGSEVAIALLPMCRRGGGAVQPCSTTGTLELAGMRRTAKRVNTNSSNGGAMIWMGWLPLRPGRSPLDGCKVASTAKLRVSVVQEMSLFTEQREALIQELPAGEATTWLGETGCAAPQTWTASVEAVVCAQVTSASSGRSTPSSVEHLGTEDDDVLYGEFSKPFMLGSSSKIHDDVSPPPSLGDDTESGKLRAELERSKLDADKLREQQEEDRRHVQDKLSHLEVEVRECWQKRVAELEAEVESLKSALVAGKPPEEDGLAAPLSTTPPTTSRRPASALAEPSMPELPIASKVSESAALRGSFDGEWTEDEPPVTAVKQLEGVLPCPDTAPRLGVFSNEVPDSFDLLLSPHDTRCPQQATQRKPRVSPPLVEARQQPVACGAGLFCQQPHARMMSSTAARKQMLEPVPGLPLHSPTFSRLPLRGDGWRSTKTTKTTPTTNHNTAGERDSGRPPQPGHFSQTPESPTSFPPGYQPVCNAAGGLTLLASSPTRTRSLASLSTFGTDDTWSPSPASTVKAQQRLRARSSSRLIRSKMSSEKDEGVLGIFGAVGGLYQQLFDGIKCTSPDMLAASERLVEIDLSNEFPPERRASQVDLACGA